MKIALFPFKVENFGKFDKFGESQKSARNETFQSQDDWEIDLGKICDSNRVWEFIDYRCGS